MKRLIAILLVVFCLLPAAFGQVAGGAPVFSGPSGSGTAVITTNEFDASAIVSGTIATARLGNVPIRTFVAGTNIALVTNSSTLTIHGTATGTGLDGEALADALAAGTNTFAGNGGGLTNTVADRMSQHIAAYYVTNYTQDRSSIWVTGNGAAAVNGQYKVSWYYPESFLGVWTNTASTNMILMNNPTNHGGIASQPFVIAGSFAPDEFIYQENQELLGVRDDWVSGFVADGMTDFSGTATLTWGSNAVRQLVVSSWALGGTNVGIVATNLIRVSLNGNDEQATRLNGKPFKTLYVASTNSTAYDLIYIEPGYHKTKPFHMDNRNFHILGAGQDVCVVEVEHFQSGPDAFQSRAIVPWDSCSIGGFTLTNGLIALAQFETPYGATNAWVHDLTIYPPSAIRYPDNTTLNSGSGDQQPYVNVGVDVSRIGNDNRIERVKVFSGMRGFTFQTTYDTSGTITLVDCEAYCAPEYSGSPNIWTNASFIASGSTNVGGMMPLAFSAKAPAAQAVYPITVNIVGGNFVSLNGGTNVQGYVGGETQSSRNASLWISRGQTNAITLNLTGIPRFRNGNTNTTSFAVLNEATNNNVSIVGYYVSNHIAQISGSSASVYQSVNGAGTQATSGSLATMDFGTTDPVITVAESGRYAVFASSAGVTSSADTGHEAIFQVSSNAVALAGSSVPHVAMDGGLSGLVMPWNITLPVVYTDLVEGDTVALRWQSAGTSWAAQSAHLSIIKLTQPAVVLETGGGGTTYNLANSTNLPATGLADGTTGTGAFVRSNAPTIYNPTFIGDSAFANLSVTNFYTKLTNSAVVGTDGDGKLIEATAGTHYVAPTNGTASGLTSYNPTLSGTVLVTPGTNGGLQIGNGSHAFNIYADAPRVSVVPVATLRPTNENSSMVLDLMPRDSTGANPAAPTNTLSTGITWIHLVNRDLGAAENKSDWNALALIQGATSARVATMKGGTNSNQALVLSGDSMSFETGTFPSTTSRAAMNGTGFYFGNSGYKTIINHSTGSMGVGTLSVSGGAMLDVAGAAIVRTHITPTNGIVLPPLSAIPAISTSPTVIQQINISGTPILIRTNTAGAGLYERWRTTDETWVAYP